MSNGLINGMSEGSTDMLFVGVSTEDKNMVETAIKNGADVNALRIEHVLVHAIRKANEDIIKLLLDGKADPNVLSGSGNTPLMLSIERGGNIVKLLLDFKADSNVTSWDGKTLLMQAASRPNNLILLLKARANPNIQDKYGNTLLMYAANSCIRDSIKLLLQAGASLDSKNKEGKTALDITIEKNCGLGTKLIEEEISLIRDVINEKLLPEITDIVLGYLI